ncbi:amidohydrolase [Streptomyces clavifer]|uniref:amidohydrolase n=1 Tax=Streptomyces clavifer TaxID=68188 RepID=UPI002E808AC5|nr:amidohydrolase [Streptomyces clavifer]WRY80041.1 amidohydrolase [Streptomyces clavifer]WRY86277.1 amidohydrolase [Streptomyces clavifer]WUC32336.1 amidohydrolase [Streptomyces clavifer]
MSNVVRRDADIAALGRLNEIHPRLESLYKDLHAHPELAFTETRTAGVVADGLARLGFRVTTGVGGTGVVGVLDNGEGPRVLLRADFDALPMREQTGLDYASAVTGTGPDGKQVPVMHACGHDMHVACLLGALDLLAGAHESWSGTLVAVFQPAEELGSGAQAMVDDGLFEKAGAPDVVLGQHVAPIPAGMIGCHPGPALAATDALRVRMFGRGAHGSRPETAIDPVVMAAATVMRLQTVVSREIAGGDTAVVTVGALNAGTKDNVIPDEAELKLNIRTYTPEVRATVLNAITRIVNAEATAAGAEQAPEIAPLDTFPVLVNDLAAVERTTEALRAHFGEHTILDTGPGTGSEDCGIFATASGAPLCYWYFGGTDPEVFAAAEKKGTVGRDIPSNHSPRFAPLINPTLANGVQAMTVAALAWLTPR